ncbi:MAG: hypothetical protein ISS93_03335 [Candidatus Aenigmarchaeota archaeon]|nr:hypothetical protein [Candidatus Aenigmarchaeota archaeon]
MNSTEITSYYSRKGIQQSLLQAAKGREVAGAFKNGSFGSRPGTLIYPQDIISQVRSGIVEFHSSLELWENPMTLQKRKGFDLILDLDCKKMEHGKIAAIVLGWALEKHNIKRYSIKFSGNTGFHVGIPWKSLPNEIGFKPTASLFPDAARKVGLYLKEFMKERLEKKLLKDHSPETLAEQTEKPLEKLLTKDGINPFQVVDIDPVLISPRHLLRMPYSLNRKAFLVSIPFQDKETLENFEKSHATPEKVRSGIRFPIEGKEGEASLLVAEALDWHSRREAPTKKVKKYTDFKQKIPEASFPPCIKSILMGLEDGKRRAVFLMINFLKAMKWNWDEIEMSLGEWNKRNKPPLTEQALTSLLRYYREKKGFPPPNCYQEGWYLSLGVCSPDNVCKSRENIKNPVNYAFRLMKRGKQRKAPAFRKPRKKAKPAPKAT